jgi:nucleotide-binding universal stress UspA family protein
LPRRSSVGDPAARLEDYTEHAERHLENAGVIVERHLENAGVTVALERDSEAIVVGIEGRGRLERGLLGSTSLDIIRHAPCPVVVVRMPPEKKKP